MAEEMTNIKVTATAAAPVADGISPLLLKPGMEVKIHQKIKETDAKGKEKERIQIFQGMILSVRHGKEQGATITVRKVSEGVGVERIYPIYSPIIAKIELVRAFETRRAKLFFVRGKNTRKLKEVRKTKTAV